MSKSDTAGLQSAGTTDPRDRNIHLGIDSHGEHHVYQTRHEQILVVDPVVGEMVTTRDISRTTVDAWMAEFDWDERNYGVPLLEMLAADLGSEEGA